MSQKRWINKRHNALYCFASVEFFSENIRANKATASVECKKSDWFHQNNAQIEFIEK